MKFLATQSNKLGVHHCLAREVRKWPGGAWFVQFARQWWGNGDGSDQWQRVVMNEHVRKLVASLGPQQLDVLEVSGGNWPTQGYFRSYRAVSYPDFDICKDTLDQHFDLIIVEQVFEHLLWPYRAGCHVYEMLRPGGHFLISTPFMIPIHECPHDCTRWTATGLRHFLAECGFDLDRVNAFAWGNLACVKANLKRWQIYQRWRHARRNEPRYPVQVWALAKK